MKTSPASVHLRANMAFSLSCKSLSVMHAQALRHWTYKAISRMDAYAFIHFGSFNNFVTIQVS